MSVHDDAEAARRKVYDDAAADLEQRLRDAVADRDAARFALAERDGEYDTLAARVVEQESTIAALRDRIAELENLPAPQPQPQPKRCLVGIYNGTTDGADDPFYAALGDALGAGTSYYTSNARQGGRYVLRSWDLKRIERGYVPFIHFQSRIPGQPQTHPWADVAAGKHDTDFIQWAHALKDAPAGTSFSFDGEPEVRLEDASHQPLPKDGKNTPEHYAAALRRIHEVMSPIAPELDYRFWFAGHDRSAYMESFYPGDEYVTSIAIDPYVWAYNPASTTPLQKYRPIVDWVRSRSWGKGKRIGISETGIDTKHGDDAMAAFWRAMPDAVDALDLAWVAFYNRSNWQINAATYPKAWAAYVAAMKLIAGTATS